MRDAREKGITRTADSTSVTAKTMIETFVGVRSCGFLQKTTQVSKFPTNARIIKMTRRMAPTTISAVVKHGSIFMPLEKFAAKVHCLGENIFLDLHVLMNFAF